MQSIYDGLDNSKDPTQRDYCSRCVFGDLGRGKSTFIRQQAKFYIERTLAKKVPRKVLIFTALYPFLAFWLIWG